ncbi:hypothetical protein EIP91_008093 [Steccherinum ochraceum]|uniref:Metallo-beta-lactamase domain-containing protein n=1 Tax=Steccherinum ochraceum TaxID=92696 RepID=A0A4R0R3B0_9APHY|nr:hypothetical protein EIP91_008093 [Steccherinum ochraceum]
MTTTSPPLPPPTSPSQPYIHISALDAGHLDIEAWEILADAREEDNELLRVPSLAFLLTHSVSGKKMMFDLGIRRASERTVEGEPNVLVPQTSEEALRKGGVDPGDVEVVVLSHLHWDHVGLASEYPNATFIVGPDCTHLIDEPHPELYVLPNPVPSHSTQPLTASSFPTSIGPFPQALDYFSDGSLYLINSPGHFPGHLNALLRTSPSGSWVYLAGDTVHDWRVLKGEKAMARFHHPKHGLVCAHEDFEAAKVHVERVRALVEVPRVLVLIAHDWEWFEANKGGEAFLPGRIPPKLD